MMHETFFISDLEWLGYMVVFSIGFLIYLWWTDK